MSTRNHSFFYRTSLFLPLSFATSFFLLILLSNSDSAAAESCRLPEEYGEIVCRFNEKSLNHLYVIGIAHRDSLTRANASRTPPVQAEVYKIGEWLIQNQGVELILPEGFFSATPDKPGEKKARGGLFHEGSRQSGMASLEQRLSTDRRMVNAEMLLKENFPLRLRQVEDRELYQTVFENIRLLAESGGSMEKNLFGG